MLLVHELRLRFLEPIKGIWREWVLRLVRMDQQGFDAVAFFDVRFWDSGLQIKNSISTPLVSTLPATGRG
jgi:hypothetical protein